MPLTRPSQSTIFPTFTLLHFWNIYISQVSLIQFIRHELNAFTKYLTSVTRFGIISQLWSKFEVFRIIGGGGILYLAKY